MVRPLQGTRPGVGAGGGPAGRAGGGGQGGRHGGPGVRGGVRGARLPRAEAVQARAAETGGLRRGAGLGQFGAVCGGMAGRLPPHSDPAIAHLLSQHLWGDWFLVDLLAFRPGNVWCVFFFPLTTWKCVVCVFFPLTGPGTTH